MLQSLGSQRVRHDLATEQQQFLKELDEKGGCAVGQVIAQGVQGEGKPKEHTRLLGDFLPLSSSYHIFHHDQEKCEV